MTLLVGRLEWLKEVVSQGGSSVEQAHARKPLTKMANLTRDNTLTSSKIISPGHAWNIVGQHQKFEVLVIYIVTGMSSSKQLKYRDEDTGSRSQDLFGSLRFYSCVLYWQHENFQAEYQKKAGKKARKKESRICLMVHWSLDYSRLSLSFWWRTWPCREGPLREISHRRTVTMDVPITWPLRRNSSLEELALTIYSHNNNTEFIECLWRLKVFHNLKRKTYNGQIPIYTTQAKQAHKT